MDINGLEFFVLVSLGRGRCCWALVLSVDPVPQLHIGIRCICSGPNLGINDSGGARVGSANGHRSQTTSARRFRSPGCTGANAAVGS